MDFLHLNNQQPEGGQPLWQNQNTREDNSSGSSATDILVTSVYQK
jgi:hypothetical protein